AVLLAQEQIARLGIDGEAPERGGPRVHERDPDAGVVRQVAGYVATEVQAVDLAGGVTARAGAQDDERASIEHELERTGHRHADDLDHGAGVDGRGRRGEPDPRQRREDSRRTPRSDPGGSLHDRVSSLSPWPS